MTPFGQSKIHSKIDSLPLTLWAALGFLLRAASILSKNLISIHREDFGTFEAEAHFLQTGFTHGSAQTGAVAGIEHEKSTAEGAVGHSEVIPGVDVVVSSHTAKRSGPPQCAGSGMSSTSTV